MVLALVGPSISPVFLARQTIRAGRYGLQSLLVIMEANEKAKATAAGNRLDKVTDYRSLSAKLAAAPKDVSDKLWNSLRSQFALKQKRERKTSIVIIESLPRGFLAGTSEFIRLALIPDWQSVA
jgi:hypothetical protein